MKLNSFKSSETVVITFFIIVLLVVCALLVNLMAFKHDTNVYNLYVALGTLLLALVTGLLAFFSWWSIRQNSEREKRRIEETSLNEIIEWAEGVISVIQDLNRNKQYQLSLEYQKNWVRLDVLNAKKYFLIGVMNRGIGEDFREIFNKTIKEFDKYYQSKDEGDYCIKAMLALLTFIGEYEANI